MFASQSAVLRIQSQCFQKGWQCSMVWPALCTLGMTRSVALCALEATQNITWHRQETHIALIFSQLLPCTCHLSSRSWQQRRIFMEIHIKQTSTSNGARFQKYVAMQPDVLKLKPSNQSQQQNKLRRCYFVLANCLFSCTSWQVSAQVWRVKG